MGILSRPRLLLGADKFLSLLIDIGMGNVWGGTVFPDVFVVAGLVEFPGFGRKSVSTSGCILRGFCCIMLSTTLLEAMHRMVCIFSVRPFQISPL